MAILQFAFGNGPQAPTFKPHNHVRDLVAYTGTTDNDTVMGWWTSSGSGDSTRSAEDVIQEHAYARAYLGFKDDPIHWVLIRAIMSSVGAIRIPPPQCGESMSSLQTIPLTFRSNPRASGCRSAESTNGARKPVLSHPR